MSLPWWEIVLRLACATVVGILFGVERKKEHKPVGARTNVLICLAACVVTLISAYGYEDAILRFSPGADIRSDPARLMVGVLSGIGFIGAGIIWKSPSGPIYGITTAAAVYMVAVLGMAAGMGLYFLLGAATAFSFLTLLADDIVEWYKNKRPHQAAPPPAPPQEEDEARQQDISA